LTLKARKNLAHPADKNLRVNGPFSESSASKGQAKGKGMENPSGFPFVLRLYPTPPGRFSSSSGKESPSAHLRRR